MLHITNYLQERLYFTLDKMNDALNSHANDMIFQLYLMRIFCFYEVALFEILGKLDLVKYCCCKHSS